MKITDLCVNAKKIAKNYRLLSVILLVVLTIVIGFLLMVHKQNPEIVTTMDTLVKLTENIRHNYKNRPDYWGLSTQSVIQKQIVTASMLQNNRLVSPIASEINVGGDENGSMVMPGTRSFYIALKNLSAKNCVALAIFPLSEKNELGLLSITFKVNDKETVFQWGGENSLPVTKERATKICRKNSIILWNFE